MAGGQSEDQHPLNRPQHPGGLVQPKEHRKLANGVSGLKLSWNVGGSSLIQLAALGPSRDSASESLTAGVGRAGAASHWSQACSRCSGNTSSTNQLMKRETGGGGWLPSQAQGSWTAWRWPGGTPGGGGSQGRCLLQPLDTLCYFRLPVTSLTCLCALCSVQASSFRKRSP